MFKAIERCNNRTFGPYGLETLNHRSELKIFWDTFRSQIAELWFPYDRRIANDMVLSSAIVCDRLRSRSQAIAEVCFHMIADDRRTFCDPRSSAIIWKPALSVIQYERLLSSRCSLGTRGIRKKKSPNVQGAKKRNRGTE